MSFNQTALATIFDEFCTPRQRPYGRGGMFTVPPEYDPRDVVTEVAIGARRVEIETLRPTTEVRTRYVLLKTGGGWLVDSKTTNGNKATL